ncbi:MAG TPA: class I SAM-dependent methyltransferase [Anaeromyxobacter sp.]
MKTMMLKAANGAPSARIDAEVTMQAIETVSMPLRESATEALDHPVRGRVNAWGLRLLDAYFHRKYRDIKREAFGGLPRVVVEIGAGTGANLRYLDPGTRVIAIEPNVHMHRYLRAAARRWHVPVDLRAATAERIPLPDGSVDAVMCSLVLCSVRNPARALAEIRRVLRPGGRFWCLEHVAAPEGTALAQVQRALARPWHWLFEGCDPRRDVTGLLRAAGFASVEVRPFTLHTGIVPIRRQVAVVAVR